MENNDGYTWAIKKKEYKKKKQKNLVGVIVALVLSMEGVKKEENEEEVPNILQITYDPFNPVIILYSHGLLS